ncbi:hypothetical protein ACU4GD_44495 [Cupriavidus basilensis]
MPPARTPRNDYGYVHSATDAYTDGARKIDAFSDGARTVFQDYPFGFARYEGHRRCGARRPGRDAADRQQERLYDHQRHCP